ncbi:replication protein A 70 kDa DNA-binding subunit B-like [Nicotiana tabacum]|uniref:Replication protein A 70 kDa DNA-binding subunit B-like n=1 Tax=Nicotiana tabacum TaxID=4097 RepID=A0AC58S5X1_TOBAC
MATGVELSKQCLPISKVPKYSSDWVIKVFVVRRSKVIPYKNQRNGGVFKTRILVDEEGTKIQATLFNKHVEKWKDFFEPNRSYFIINGRLDRVNPNYFSTFPPNNSQIAFCSWKRRLTDDTIFDVVAILVTVKPLIGEGRSRRREIIVTNERSDLTSITLWGDFAENDGELLEKMKYDKPILGFCDVRVSIYKGNFGISSIPVSSVLINPTIQKATELRNWRDSMKAENKDIALIPTKTMKSAKEVKLVDIMDGVLADAHEIYYKFKVKITDIINKDEPWYSSCKKYFKRVDVIKDTATCGNCNIENVDYESRYCLRIEVYAGERRVRVILFDAAEYLFGCDVKEYIQSISTKEANLSEEIVAKIRKIMDENPYAQFFSQLKDQPTFQNLQVRIAATAFLDQRVYNKPTVDQVAAIWIDGNNPNIHLKEIFWSMNIQATNIELDITMVIMTPCNILYFFLIVAVPQMKVPVPAQMHKHLYLQVRCLPMKNKIIFLN